MRIQAKVVGLFLIIFLVTGCSKVVVMSDADPNVNLAELNKFYVQKFGPDERGVEKVIAGKLNEFGFKATSGVSAKPPHPVDAIVTYKDRWMWDITMYMLEIDVELHDPESDFVFASGSSYRTSLARKTPEEMVDEVLRNLFAGQVDLPEKQVEDQSQDDNKGWE